MSYVISPLSLNELQDYFDETAIKVIRYLISKSLFAQPERLPGDNELPIQIPKEHIEQYLVQAVGAEGIGAGSKALDIVDITNKWGADVKMLSCKTDKNGNLTNADSGETSLGQNFKDVGKQLDNLFKEKKYEQIKDEWGNVVKNKLQPIQEIYKLNTILYFILLRANNKLFLVGMSVDIDKIDNVTVDIHRTTKDSVFLDGYIEKPLGYTKIYKAKKRLELRLKPIEWYRRGNYIEFDLNFIPKEKNLRDFVENGGNLNKYGIEELKNIFINSEEIIEES